MKLNLGEELWIFIWLIWKFHKEFVRILKRNLRLFFLTNHTTSNWKRDGSQSPLKMRGSPIKDFLHIAKKKPSTSSRSRSFPRFWHISHSGINITSNLVLEIFHVWEQSEIGKWWRAILNNTLSFKIYTNCNQNQTNSYTHTFWTRCKTHKTAHPSKLELVKGWTLFTWG